ncbi:G1 family glutamic endopeptidase [Catenulispora pinisilvae]|uniref:G1 family glutamic endopeptidase n=1 Tax=Catenulispora pinisilvae TaxID=2705253 RepID=UPI0018918576|nr:G1 family glutamic endopeptidase [Catenulispora pinisilvae]
MSPPSFRNRGFGATGAAVAVVAVGTLAVGAAAGSANAAAPAAHPAAWAAGPVVANSNSAAVPSHSGLRPFVESSTQNWSGYVADTNGGTYTSVESSWVEPAVDCSKGDGWVLLWVGLDGSGSPTVEQTGTGALCSAGQASYATWWETFSNPIQFYKDPIKVGDKFDAKVTFKGNAEYELTLTNLTEGWIEDHLEQAASGATNASAEVVAETPRTIFGQLTPLPDFGTATFTGSQVNGQPIGAANPVAVALARNGDTLATAGPLNNGTDFTETWLANN